MGSANRVVKDVDAFRRSQLLQPGFQVFFIVVDAFVRAILAGEGELVDCPGPEAGEAGASGEGVVDGVGLGGVTGATAGPGDAPETGEGPAPGVAAGGTVLIVIWPEIVPLEVRALSTLPRNPRSRSAWRRSGGSAPRGSGRARQSR